ncbi:MAG: hypothetical protein A2W03_13235 [Candidatus Aminicenantes bacterium RBG_16_63_16]|nr:MAG: hypothetical protein A2W03_13235 [Candidatus Aminicenantes bacterium RBG_16_63_16]
MKKIIGLSVLAVFLLPMLGFSEGAFSFRLGYFVPNAKSDLWDIEFENMTFQKKDFNALTFGVSYEYFMTREVSLVIGADFYSRSRVGIYRDWVGYTIDGYDYAFPFSDYDGDFDLSQRFRTSIVPIQASIKLTPLGRRAGIIPYIGGGVSLYVWSVDLEGDLVDFEDQYVYDDPDLGDVDVYGVYPIDARQESKLAVGFHAFGGIMIPIGRRTAIEAEFKYSNGKGKFSEPRSSRDQGNGFAGFDKFDLGGYQVSIGINYWF